MYVSKSVHNQKNSTKTTEHRVDRRTCGSCRPGSGERGGERSEDFGDKPLERGRLAVVLDNRLQ